MSPDLIDRYALLDPAKHADALPDWSITTPPLLQSIDEQTGSLDVQDVRIVASKPEPRRSGPLAAAVAFGVVPVVGITRHSPPEAQRLPLLPRANYQQRPCSISKQAGPIPGLSTISHPVTQLEVAAVLIAMPGSIDGLAKGGDEGPDHVAVIDSSGADEATIGIMAQPGDSRYGTSPTVWLTMMADGPEFDLVTGSLDPESDLIWIVGTLSTDDATFHMAAWGQPDEGFLFYVEATTAEHPDAAITAFVAGALGLTG